MRINPATLAVAFTLAVGGLAQAEVITALTTSNSLVRFDSLTPSTLIGAAVPISGLASGQTLQGIDFRPRDRVLVCLGYSSANGTAGIYSINTNTGVATSINGNPISLPTGVARFFIDFDPVSNSLRIVGSNRSNFHINVGGTSTLVTDTALNPFSPLVTAIAHDRNTAIAAQSTLFDLDFATETLYSQGTVNGTISPNTGTLFLINSITGISASVVTGFDISGTSGIGYLSTDSSLFTINLSSGAAASVGRIGSGSLGILDISAAPIPEPGGLTLLSVFAAGLYRALWRKS